MEKKSRIFVAGHRGMVGSAMVDLLQKKGFDNLLCRSSRELDLRKQEEVEAFFQKERPDYVFHFAAKVGGINANITYPADFLYDNVMINSNVIKASYRAGVKKLLYLGSSCIYPRECEQPMKEEYLLSGKLEPTNEGYALAKIVGLKLCEYFNKEFGTNYLALMPCNLYGKGDDFNFKTSHLIAALIRKFHLAKLLSEEKYEEIVEDFLIFGNAPVFMRGKRALSEEMQKHIREELGKYGISEKAVVLWGTGTPHREFFYVEELADACLMFMTKYNAADLGGIINVGTGCVDHTIRELSEITRKTVGCSVEILWDDKKHDGMPRKLLNVAKAKSFGWMPSINVKEGISMVFQWYKAQRLLT